MKKTYRNYVLILPVVSLLTACGVKQAGIDRNSQEIVSVPPEESRADKTENDLSGENSEAENTGKPDEEQTAAVLTEIPADEHSAQTTAAAEQERNRIIRGLSPEEWEQLAEDGTFLTFHDGDGGYFYVDPMEELICHQEIYAHERAEGSYFRPSYSSSSDGTMLAPNGSNEGGHTLYDVYYGKELLISGIRIVENPGEYLLDVRYDADAQEVFLLTYRKDSEKKEEGFMIYNAASADRSVQPFSFYPILTGDEYQEFVYPDWIWSAVLMPNAIYFDVIPARRVDLETGEITEWGISAEDYSERTGFDNLLALKGSIVCGNGYIMMLVQDPPPEGVGMEEWDTRFTGLIYREDGELEHIMFNIFE